MFLAQEQWEWIEPHRRNRKPDARWKEAQGLQKAVGGGADDGVAPEPPEAPRQPREAPFALHGVHPARLLHDHDEENPSVLAIDENRVFVQLLWVMWIFSGGRWFPCASA
jgi:hypothetical protein